MLTNYLSACTYLSSTVSQLFKPQVQKIAVFTYRSPHFSFPWRRPCDYHAMCCMDGRQFNACQTPRNIYLSIFNSFRVIRCWSQCVSPKIAILLHFCFSWGRPFGNHAKCCMDGKRIRCLQIVSQHVPIYLQQFPSYSNRKCRKSPFSRTAAHIYVSPEDAPGAITLNVAWIEREFDAYKLSCCMCPSQVAQ